MKLTKDETITLRGGASAITAAALTAIVSIVKTLYTYGQNLGSAIKRKLTKTTC